MDYSIAQEVNYLRSEDDIYYHYEEFTSGLRKILFITGLSGGGKTTLSEKIAKENGGITFPLDFFYHLRYFEETPEKLAKYPYFKIFIKFGDANGYFNIREDGTRYINNNKLDNGPSSNVFEFIQWILKNEKSLKQPICIEGVQLHLFYELHPLLFGNPLVIKSTTTFQSFARAAKRDFKKPILIAIFKRLGKSGTDYVSWYMEMTKAINVLIDEYDKYESSN